jgi:hypothetical protein
MLSLPTFQGSLRKEFFRAFERVGSPILVCQRDTEQVAFSPWKLHSVGFLSYACSGHVEAQAVEDDSPQNSQTASLSVDSFQDHVSFGVMAWFDLFCAKLRRSVQNHEIFGKINVGELNADK